MSLTDKKILDAKEKGAHSLLADGRGLYLETTKTGRQRWLFRYQFEGKSYKFPLADYPQTDRDQARILASTETAILNHATHPRNPLEVKAEKAELERKLAELQLLTLERQNREEAAAAARLAARMKFSDLFERWHRQQIQHNRKDKGLEIRRKFKRDVLPHIGDLFADEVSRRDISEVLNIIVERGARRMANVTLSDIRQCFGWAIGAGLLDNDPVSHLTKKSFGGRDKPRERNLSDDEVRYLLQTALPNSSLAPQYQLGVKVLLATMARVGELLKAQLNDINLETRQWYIPAINSKNGFEHTIHLSNFACQAFSELKSLQRSKTWLFPSSSGQNHIHEKALTKQLMDRQKGENTLQRRCQDSSSLILSGGIWRSHDLRRTGSTMMGEQKIAPHITNLCQNHVAQDSNTRTYQLQQSLSERKDAFNILGKHLEQLISKTESDSAPCNVIYLKRA